MEPLWEECQGDIGSVMVYDRQLTPDEIKQTKKVLSDDICEDF